MSEERINELLKIGYEYLKKENATEAKRVYNEIISLLPGEPVGYVGLACAISFTNNSVLFKDIFAPILSVRRSSRYTVSEKYNKELKKLVNHGTGETKSTLLSKACTYCKPEIVNILIEWGADVNKKSIFDTTPLWHIAFKPLPNKNKKNAREIARILLEHGAETDVKNKNGVALYNENTDSVIAKMIKDKNAEITFGDASKLEVEHKNLFATILTCLGAIPGLAVVVGGRPFWGCIILAIFALAGYVLGGQIDTKREETRDYSKTAVKIISIFLLVVLACTMLFGSCSSGCCAGGGSSSTCGSCGRTYSAGDIGGNYKSIARTGFCKKCAGNYHSMEQFRGK